MWNWVFETNCWHQVLATLPSNSVKYCGYRNVQCKQRGALMLTSKKVGVGKFRSCEVEEVELWSFGWWVVELGQGCLLSANYKVKLSIRDSHPAPQHASINESGIRALESALRRVGEKLCKIVKLKGKWKDELATLVVTLSLSPHYSHHYSILLLYYSCYHYSSHSWRILFTHVLVYLYMQLRSIRWSRPSIEPQAAHARVVESGYRCRNIQYKLRCAKYSQSIRWVRCKCASCCALKVQKHNKSKIFGRDSYIWPLYKGLGICICEVIYIEI